MPKSFFPENIPAAPSSTRRSFVALAAATPLLAAAAAVLTRRPPATPALPEPRAVDAVPESGSYHETEHIRRYYRSAKYF